MLLGSRLHVQPAPDYAAALERFAALRGLDGANVASHSGSRFYARGERAARAVVLVHGLTNAPQQWDVFARELHGRGANVIVPRLPGHGHINRRTKTIGRVTADELLATVNEAVDIACGAGERVVLAGLSIGGSLTAWLAIRRPAIARGVCIVPFFGVKNLGYTGNRALTAALETLPNAYVPWNPGGDGSQTPAYGYAAFPTRLLAENLRIGLDVARAARRGIRVPGELAFLLNAREPACDNTLSKDVASRLSASARAITVTVLADLPANHDIIDPTNPSQRIALVYPTLHSLIEAPFTPR